MAKNYLDKDGLSYFWNKIKAKIPTKTSQLENDSGFADASSLNNKQDKLTAGAHISISNNVVSAKDYISSKDPVATANLNTVSGEILANGSVTKEKIKSGDVLTLTMSKTDIGEGAVLAENTLYGVYE